MMNIHAGRERTKLSYKILSAFIAFTFSFTSVVPPSYAQSLASLNLPVPGTMVTPSAAFVPVLLKGMTIYPNNPLQFDFIIDSGNTNFKEDQIKTESQRLVKYFLASMTIPKDDLWVNLSPYEKDRIIPDELGKTELGRDMLAQDYILKQLTASLMYPEKELGKEFWDKVYKLAQEKYGTTEIPVDTFNKVWILPETATVYEHGQTVYIVEAKLRVMLDADYLAMSHQSSDVSHQKKAESQNLTTEDRRLTTQIVKEIILPEIEKEVNEGQNFAPLRQIYHSLILAKWYKETIKNSLLSKVYVDKKLINGIRLEDGQLKGEDGSIIDSQFSIVDQIYDQYMEAYKKGVFNYIKEDYDRLSNETIPRKYFSGGEQLTQIPLTKTNNPVAGNGLEGKGHRVTVINTPPKDGASSPIFEKWRINRHINRLLNTSIDVEKRKEHLKALEYFKNHDAFKIIQLAQKLKERIPTGKQYIKENKILEFLSKAKRFQEEGYDFKINYSYDSKPVEYKVVRYEKTPLEDFGYQPPYTGQQGGIIAIFEDHSKEGVGTYGKYGDDEWDEWHTVTTKDRTKKKNIEKELIEIVRGEKLDQSSSPITPQEARAMIKGKLLPEQHHLIDDTHVQLAMAYEGNFEAVYHAGPPERIEIIRAKAVSVSSSPIFSKIRSLWSGDFDEKHINDFVQKNFRIYMQMESVPPMQVQMIRGLIDWIEYPPKPDWTLVSNNQNFIPNPIMPGKEGLLKMAIPQLLVFLAGSDADWRGEAGGDYQTIKLIRARVKSGDLSRELRDVLQKTLKLMEVKFEDARQDPRLRRRAEQALSFIRETLGEVAAATVIESPVTKPKGAYSIGIATQANNIDEVRRLIERGEDMEDLNEVGATALINASQFGYTEIVKLLLAKGANSNAKTRKRTASLHVAADKGHIDIVQLLIDYHADINATDSTGATPLFYSAQRGKLEIVKKLLRKNGIDLNKPNYIGATPLFIASMRGYTEIVKELLDAGADARIESWTGSTAYNEAVMNGHDKIAKMFKNRSMLNGENDQSSSPITPQEARALINGRLTPERHHLINDTHVQLAMVYEGNFRVVYHPGPPEGIEIIRGEKFDQSSPSTDLGGIDMNAIDLDRQGAGVDIQFDPVELQELIDLGIDGFAPVIINITPLPSVLPLLGLEPANKEEGMEMSRLD